MTMETSLKQCTMPNVSLRFDDNSIPTSQQQWIWVLQLNNEDCLIVVRSLCWSPSDALQLQAISQGTNFSPFTRCECQCSVPPNSSMINMRNNLASCPITKTLPQRLNRLNKINNQALDPSVFSQNIISKKQKEFLYLLRWISRRKLYPRQRTNVIFMAMCYNNCFNFVTPSFDKCGIRYNFLDSKFIIAEIQVRSMMSIH